MYTEAEKIFQLEKIYNRSTNIGAYYTNEEIKASANDYAPTTLDEYIYTQFSLNSQKKDVSYQSVSYFNYILEQIKELIRENYLENLPESIIKHIRGLSNNTKNITGQFETLMNPSKINEMCINLMSPWVNIANKNNIDIKEELTQMNLFSENIKIVKNISEVIDAMEEIYFITNTMVLDKNYNSDVLLKAVYELEEKVEKYGFMNVEKYFEHNNIKLIFDNLLKAENSIQNKLLKNGIVFTIADKYSLIDKNNTPITFIENKQLNTDIKFSLDLKSSKKYNEFVMFNDNSIAIKYKDGIVETIKNNTDAQLLVIPVFKSYIESILRKKPTTLKFFIDELDRNKGYNYQHISNCLITINTFIDNEDILKKCKFSLNEMDTKSLNVSSLFLDQLSGASSHSFEYLDDKMNKIIREHKYQKFCHCISSNKYNHLYDKGSYEILRELYTLNVTEDMLQDNIGKKMASFKTNIEFNSALNKLWDNYNGFNLDDLIEKGVKSNTQLILKEDDLLIFKVTKFNQSQYMGSPSWCISRDIHYFDSYTSNGQYQYFIYDLSKHSKESSSMIGLTLTNTGNYNTAHKKNDDKYEYCNKIRDYQLKIIANSMDDFPHLDSDLSFLIKKSTELKKDIPKL